MLMLNISLRDRVSNQTVRGKTGVTDAVKRITTLKWIWIGQVTKARDARYTKKFLKWRPRHDDYPGSPPTELSDDIKCIQKNWIQSWPN